MKIYVGNLSYRTTEEDLRREFEQFGELTSVAILTDRETGRSRGFGFVEMASDSEAKAAIEGMNGKPLGDRTLTVNEAKPRTENRGGGGYGQRSGGYGGQRGGGNRGGYGDSGYGGGRQRY